VGSSRAIKVRAASSMRGRVARVWGMMLLVEMVIVVMAMVIILVTIRTDRASDADCSGIKL
jgi:hypothetical protein